MRSHGTGLFTTALYHVTSCDQSQLSQYFSMAEEEEMVAKSVNDHRDHMVQGYSQQPCTM
ncbi:unnamed protein product [Staurois parvus]|uniref:Uncharacterized protein n=1 Tax=Staurois parvus TaxID=386267 RepID=A0ABN9FQ96_9NEOB|nr:unnamed protein product [Staurois parvus]